MYNDSINGVSDTHKFLMYYGTDYVMLSNVTD